MASSSVLSASSSELSANCCTLLLSVISRMNRNMASTMPISIATVRSTNTVSRKVTTITAASVRDSLRMEIKLRHSLMLYATMISTPASVAMGISAAILPMNSSMSNSVSECTIPAMGVRPPFLILVAVRAIAPVAGIPPKIEEKILAVPCATSSILER